MLKLEILNKNLELQDRVVARGENENYADPLIELKIRSFLKNGFCKVWGKKKSALGGEVETSWLFSQ